MTWSLLKSLQNSHFTAYFCEENVYLSETWKTDHMKCVEALNINIWYYWLLSRSSFMVCRAILRVDRTTNTTIRIAVLIAPIALLIVRILVHFLVNRTKRILMILKNHYHPRIVRAIVVDVQWEAFAAASAQIFVLRLAVSRKRLCRRF